MQLTPEQVSTIETTRERMKAHRALPLFKRINNRLLGDYPDYADRELLRRSEMKPIERISENITRAVRDTKEANSSFNFAIPAMGIGFSKFHTGSLIDKTIKASVMIEVAPESEYRDLFALLGMHSHTQTAGLGAGVYLNRDHSENPESIGGIYTATDGSTLSKADITPALVESLTEDTRELLEQFTGNVAGYAMMAYMMRVTD